MLGVKSNRDSITGVFAEKLREQIARYQKESQLGREQDKQDEPLELKNIPG